MSQLLPFIFISSLGLLPLLIWNLRHDLIGFRHDLGHAGEGEPAPGLLGPLGFLGYQAAMLLGLGFYAWVRAAWSGRFSHDLRWWLSVPVVLAFLVVSVRAVGQANWAAAAYVTGLPMAVEWIAERIRWRSMKPTILVVALLGLGINLFLRFPSPVRPILAEFAKAPTVEKPTPVRNLDVTARLAGWKAMAADVDAVRTEVRHATGEEPLLAAMTWTIPGELAFYCDGQPTVFSFGTALADRHSQFDLWRPNPVADAQAFEGRTFVYVGAALPEGTFDRVELVKVGEFRDRGVPLLTWEIRVGYGFRGFPLRANPPGF